MLTSLLKSFDTIGKNAATSRSITLSLTGIGFMIISKSTRVTCGLSFGKKVIIEIVMQKYNN